MLQPFLLGSGRSAQCIAISLEILKRRFPEFKLQSPIQLKRSEAFPNLNPQQLSLLAIANPSALHTQLLIQAAQAGFDGIVAEKPICTSRAQLEQIEQNMTKFPPTWVLHGYRQSWGIQKIKELLNQKRLGNLFSIEGRYWQSSSASRALEALAKVSSSWKNDIQLNGDFDTLTDLATHWLDLVIFVAGSLPIRAQSKRLYANAETPHRDTHVLMQLEFPQNLHSIASISKTAHGSNNELEIHVHGTQGSLSWRFCRPDELTLGQGSRREILTKTENDYGIGLAPFHGAGWIEGYVEILKCACRKMQGIESPLSAPSLKEAVESMKVLFKSISEASI